MAFMLALLVVLLFSGVYLCHQWYTEQLREPPP
jgi:hypothetical protein